METVGKQKQAKPIIMDRVYEDDENIIKLIIPTEHTAKVLDYAKQALYLITHFVKFFIVIPRVFAV